MGTIGIKKFLLQNAAWLWSTIFPQYGMESCSFFSKTFLGEWCIHSTRGCGININERAILILGTTC